MFFLLVLSKHLKYFNEFWCNISIFINSTIWANTNTKSNSEKEWFKIKLLPHLKYKTDLHAFFCWATVLWGLQNRKIINFFIPAFLFEFVVFRSVFTLFCCSTFSFLFKGFVYWLIVWCYCFFFLSRTVFCTNYWKLLDLYFTFKKKGAAK